MKGTMLGALFVATFLGAIVAANLISAHFGAGASIYNAFFMIGLVLTTRDRLHDLWGENRFRNMALLILAGSGVSYGASLLLASDALPSDLVARIALASCVAFAAAETWDAVVYQLLHRRPWLERSNVSNVVGAAFDSAIFVSIAFGWSWPIIFGQFCAKIAGGFLWSLLLQHVRSKRDEVVFDIARGDVTWR